ncbi:MAG: ribonuclease Z [Thermoprotei archaeon]
MDLSIAFLGTGAGAPTPRRGAPSIIVRRGSRAFMFDCGEGTQIAMKRFRTGFSRLTDVIVTHMHGDHVLGVPGLLMSLSLNASPEAITVHGPKGLGEFLDAALRTTSFRPKFDLKINEFEPPSTPSTLIDEKDFSVQIVSADHSMPSFAVALVEKSRPGVFDVEACRRLGVPKGPLWGRLQRGEKITVNGETITPEQVMGPRRRGRKIVYSGDTRPCERVLELGAGADVFIHEATMPDDSSDEAWEGGHSTLSQALQIIGKSGCSHGVLTNFGQKVRDDDLVRVLQGFPSITPARDGLVLSVPLPQETIQPLQE